MQRVRGRLVNFRVTDEEFEQLKIACERHGSRCLSAFARKMMLNTSNADNEKPAEGGSVTENLAALDHRLSILEVSMSRLVNALSGSNIDAAASKQAK